MSLLVCWWCFTFDPADLKKPFARWLPDESTSSNWKLRSDCRRIWLKPDFFSNLIFNGRLSSLWASVQMECGSVPTGQHYWPMWPSSNIACSLWCRMIVTDSGTYCDTQPGALLLRYVTAPHLQRRPLVAQWVLSRVVTSHVVKPIGVFEAVHTVTHQPRCHLKTTSWRWFQSVPKIGFHVTCDRSDYNTVIQFYSGLDKKRILVGSLKAAEIN